MSGQLTIRASKDDPSNPSGDYNAQVPYWSMVASIMDGVAGMRAAGELYLPKFQAEKADAYSRRLAQARMTNVFSDIVSDLTQRPFVKPVQLSEDTTQNFKDFSEDVDANGGNLHVFAGKLFRYAVQDGVTWVLVDYTKGVPRDASVAEERAAGARPIWVHYKASDVLAVYSERINGEERIVEARLKEVSIERDGFKEDTVERVRVFRHTEDMAMPTWEVWRKRTDQAGETGKWELEEGPELLDIDMIPLVPIVLGERRGLTWRVDPPLRDAAYLQIELYQQENGLKNVRHFTAYPMLAANGMEPPLGEDGKPATVATGPNAVLWGAGSGDKPGEWKYLEPGGQSLTFLREDIKDTIRELRELGRQPFTAMTANLTVIATAAVQQKSNNAVEAWVGMLTNGLHTCFEVTAKWLGLDDYDVQVIVQGAFDLGIGGDATFKDVLEMGTGPEPLLSREAVLEEAKRRNILSSQYDPEEDLLRLDRTANEIPI